MKTLAEKQNARLSFLKALYDKAEGSEDHEFDMNELGEELGLSADETSAVVDYLDGEGLLAAEGSLGGGIRLSHAGIVEVEQAIQQPQRATQHFPSAIINNVITIERMVGSQIVQGSPAANQSGTFSDQDWTTLQTWVSSVRSKLPDLKLTDDDMADAEANLATLEAQAKAKKPNKTILGTAGAALGGLLEAAGKSAGTVAGTAIAQKLIETTPDLLKSLF